MKKVILSAFACDPTQGSELGNGWNWAIGLSENDFEVHCFTRGVGQHNIENQEVPSNLFFHYVKMPLGLEFLYGFSKPTMYLYYVLWQWLAYRKARALNKKSNFHLSHHVTWGSVQLGSFMYKLPIPFVFGPTGGGQLSLVAFKQYFGSSWVDEQKREKISRLLVRYNPACKTMLKSASAVWVSNSDTGALVKGLSAAPVYYTLDSALPVSFFPKEFKPKVCESGVLKLLWVGRLMPRKGVLMIVEVIKQLKQYPGITLTIVGDGEQGDALKAAINENGLSTTVNWKGKVEFDEIKGFYESHDVFLFASLRDSGPVQVLEAMAYGMPVVTINLHGQGSIVNDETGFRCACDTPEQAIKELAEAILTLYNTPEMVTSMSKAANKFALEQTLDNKIRRVIDMSYPNNTSGT